MFGLILHDEILVSIEEFLGALLAIKMMLEFTGGNHSLAGVPMLRVVFRGKGGGVVPVVNCESFTLILILTTSVA